MKEIVPEFISNNSEFCKLDGVKKKGGKKASTKVKGVTILHS